MLPRPIPLRRSEAKPAVSPYGCSEDPTGITVSWPSAAYPHAVCRFASNAGSDAFARSERITAASRRDPSSATPRESLGQTGVDSDRIHETPTTCSGHRPYRRDFVASKNERWSWRESNPRPPSGCRPRYDHSRDYGSTAAAPPGRWTSLGGLRRVFPRCQRSFSPSAVFPAVNHRFCCRAAMVWPRVPLLVAIFRRCHLRTRRQERNRCCYRQLC